MNEKAETKSVQLNDAELLSAATNFVFYPTGATAESPEIHMFSVEVVRRAPGRFAVIHRGDCWNGNEWVYESLPSHRTDEFKTATRFPLAEAVELARGMVDELKLQGKTYSEWTAFWAEREAQKV